MNTEDFWKGIKYNTPAAFQEVLDMMGYVFWRDDSGAPVKRVDEWHTEDLNIRDLYDHFPQFGIYFKIEPQLIGLRFLQYKVWVLEAREFTSFASLIGGNFQSHEEFEALAFTKAFKIREEQLKSKS